MGLTSLNWLTKITLVARITFGSASHGTVSLILLLPVVGTHCCCLKLGVVPRKGPGSDSAFSRKVYQSLNWVFIGIIAHSRFFSVPFMTFSNSPPFITHTCPRSHNDYSPPPPLRCIPSFRSREEFQQSLPS